MEDTRRALHRTADPPPVSDKIFRRRSAQVHSRRGRMRGLDETLQYAAELDGQIAQIMKCNALTEDEVSNTK